MKGKFVVIIGPSASGKTRLVDTLLRKIPNSARFKNTTTRQRRPEEKTRDDYIFITRKEFEKGLEEGEFFEHAEVYGNLYGASKKVLKDTLENNDYVFAIINTEGAKFFQKNIKNASFIFIKPDSVESIKKRLEKERKDIPPEEMQKRMEFIEKEIAEAEDFDFVVENIDGQFDKMVEDVMEILKKI